MDAETAILLTWQRGECGVQLGSYVDNSYSIYLWVNYLSLWKL